MVIRMVLPKQYYRDLSIGDLFLCLDNVSTFQRSDSKVT